MSDKDVEFLNNIITVSTMKKCSERNQFTCAREVTANVMRTLRRGTEKRFPGMLPKFLQMLAKTSRTTYITDTLSVQKGNQHTVYWI
jgi:hypothetical protein